MTDEVSAPTFHLATCLRPSRCTQSSDSSELTLRRHTDPALLGHSPLFIGCLPSMSPFPTTTVLLPPPVHVCQLSAPNHCLVSVVSSVTFRPPPAQCCLHRNLGSGHTAMVPTFSLSCSSRGQEHGNNCGIQYLCFNKKQINSEIHSKYLPTKYEGETIPLICLV